jgi:diketogulonate reductase-like aldo/keto reductase
MGGTQQGRETLHSFEKSAGKLGVEHIDLLILRQALPYT